MARNGIRPSIGGDETRRHGQHMAYGKTDMPRRRGMHFASGSGDGGKADGKAGDERRDGHLEGETGDGVHVRFLTQDDEPRKPKDDGIDLSDDNASDTDESADARDNDDGSARNGRRRHPDGTLQSGSIFDQVQCDLAENAKVHSGDGGVGVDDAGMTVPNGAPVRGDDKIGVINGNGVGGVGSGIGNAGKPNGSGTSGGNGSKHDKNDNGNGKKRRVPFAAKCAIIAAVCVVAILGGIYGVGCWWFGQHLWGGTYVDGINVSGMTAQEAYDATSGNEWSLTVKDDSGDATITADDIDLHADEVDFDKLLAEQDVTQWISHLNSSQRNDIDRGVTYDEDKLERFVQSLDCVSGEDRGDAKDATVEYDDETQRYVVVKEQYGTKADEAELLDIIKQSISTLDPVTVDVDELDIYEKPTVTADDEKLNQTADTLNKALGTVIHYTIDGIENAETVDAGLIHEWVSLGDDEGIAFDEDAMREWLAGIGKEYDTVGTTRTLERADGSGTYQVSGGTYGWVTDEATELENLKTYILSGEEQSVEFATKQKAKGPKGGNDEFGGTYIELDIGRQQGYLVKNGKLSMQWRIITGNPTTGHSTSTGTYYVTVKSRDEVLRGPKDPDTGEYEWESHVDYWLGFVGGGNGYIGLEGIHDASWQYIPDRTVGGNSTGVVGVGKSLPPANGWSASSYKTRGSHGCCNSSYNDVAALYDQVDEGTPVIVHE